MPGSELLNQLLSGGGAYLGQAGGSALGGALGGPLGAGVGGFLGGAAGGGLPYLMSYLGDQRNQNSQQQGARDYLLQQLMQDPSQNGGGFEGIQNEAMRRYQQETIPQLAERFAGAGALNSSGFQQSLASSGQELQSRLAALRDQSQLQREQLNQNRLGGLGNYLNGQQQLQQQNSFMPSLSTLLNAGQLGLNAYQGINSVRQGNRDVSYGNANSRASFTPNPTTTVRFGAAV